MASQKRYDWFGAYVVGLVTAIGGGTIRDLLLGVPPFWMHTSGYLICTAFALMFVVILRKHMFRFNNTFFIFDTIGLAFFAVVGFEKTVDAHFSFWVAIMMGTITGAAGGVMRDVLLAQVPLIFRKEIYAMACVIGCLVYTTCDVLGIDNTIGQITAAVSVIATRVIAIKFGICLPILKGDEDK